MAAMVPSQTGRRLLLSKDTVHTATADPSQPCNLFFGVTGVEQFPDELVAHNASGMIVLTGLVKLPSLGRCGNREALSCQELGGGFEDMRIPLEEALEGLRQVLLQMKAIRHLVGLWRSPRGRITKDLPTVTRDPPNFRMVCKPSCCCLL